MDTLIFFGSLRSKKLLQIVLGKSLDNYLFKTGKIKNANLYHVKNETFPYLQKNNKSNNSVECLIVENLSEHDLKRIQFFESIEYQLSDINCEVDKKKYKYKYFKLIKPNKTLKKWDFQSWQDEFENYDCECAKLWMNLFDQYQNKSEEAEKYWPEILKKIIK
mgnify:FL=1